MTHPKWFLKMWSCVAPRRKLAIVNADTPPEHLQNRNLILAREDDEDWAVAFRCPCGCGDRLELQLIPEAKPHWVLHRDERGHPTLHPSVWRKTGCRSHFWLRSGRIFWC